MMAFSILNMDHKKALTFMSLGTKAIHLCLGSWSLMSKVWTLHTHFWSIMQQTSFQKECGEKCFWDVEEDFQNIVAQK
jgi:hypothetical protein